MESQNHTIYTRWLRHNHIGHPDGAADCAFDECGAQATDIILIQFGLSRLGSASYVMIP
jgi:hypothetical protein